MGNNELLDGMSSDVETCSEPYDETESNKKSTLAVHSQGRQRTDVLGSSQFGPAFPPLPDLDLDLICDIMLF